MPAHHELIIGDTYQGQIVVTEAGTPLDLTGATNPVMQLRTDRGKLLLQPSLEFTNRAAGVLSWKADAEDTVGLQPCQAVMGVRITLPGGVVRTVAEAVVTIRHGPVR